MAQTRDSNIELMRIICLVMIVIHHRIVGVYSEVPIILDGKGELDHLTIAHILINAFCYIGVNCFVLISGYYGIRLKWKKIYSLCITCSFYYFITYLLTCDEGSTFSVRHFFMPVSANIWWFITDYIILCLLSPALNTAIRHLKQKDYLLILFTLSIANIYFGYGFGIYNSNGYKVSQFVFLYFLASYIRKFFDVNHFKRKYYLYSYILGSISFGVLSIISHYYHIPKFRSFTYNNPLILISSISLLLYMLSFKFKSKIINWLSSSSLAIYLMPGTILSKYYYYNVYRPLIDCIPLGLDYLFLVFSLIIPASIFALFAICFDKIRIYIILPTALNFYKAITYKLRPVYYKIFYE